MTLRGQKDVDWSSVGFRPTSADAARMRRAGGVDRNGRALGWLIGAIALLTVDCGGLNSDYVSLDGSLQSDAVKHVPRPDAIAEDGHLAEPIDGGPIETAMDVSDVGTEAG